MQCPAGFIYASKSDAIYTTKTSRWAVTLGNTISVNNQDEAEKSIPINLHFEVLKYLSYWYLRFVSEFIVWRTPKKRFGSLFWISGKDWIVFYSVLLLSEKSFCIKIYKHSPNSYISEYLFRFFGHYRYLKKTRDDSRIVISDSIRSCSKDAIKTINLWLIKTYISIFIRSTLWSKWLRIASVCILTFLPLKIKSFNWRRGELVETFFLKPNW